MLSIFLFQAFRRFTHYSHLMSLLRAVINYKNDSRNYYCQVCVCVRKYFKLTEEIVTMKNLNKTLIVIKSILIICWKWCVNDRHRSTDPTESSGSMAAKWATLVYIQQRQVRRRHTLRTAGSQACLYSKVYTLANLYEMPKLYESRQFKRKTKLMSRLSCLLSSPPNNPITVCTPATQYTGVSAVDSPTQHVSHSSTSHSLINSQSCYWLGLHVFANVSTTLVIPASHSY